MPFSVRGVRVADTSIMSQVPSGNTNAPAIMIGERAADFIKRSDWLIKHFLKNVIKLVSEKHP